jgi:hypothetical protein
MIDAMKTIASLFLLLAFTSTTYAAVLSEQQTIFEVFQIENPAVSETYYGALTGTPHTYQFTLQQPTSFAAVLATSPKHSLSDDLSLIIVKEEKRGVSEVGRVTGKDVAWNSVYEYSTALKLRESQALDVELEKGVYRLEVSTPSNQRAYKLTLNGGGKSSYDELFLARDIFGISIFGAVFAPRVYIPLLLLIAFLLYFKYKNKYVS